MTLLWNFQNNSLESTAYRTLFTFTPKIIIFLEKYNKDFPVFMSQPILRLL